MCQATSEGGRRCPCDNSKTRRLRRHNQKAIETFQEQLTVPVTRDETHTPSQMTDTPTFAEVEEKLTQVRQLHQTAMDVKDSHKTITPELAAAEKATTELGSMITALISEETGINLDELAREHQEKGEVAAEELKQAEANLEQVQDEMIAKFSGEREALNTVLFPAYDLSSPHHQFQFRAELEQDPQKYAPRTIDEVYNAAVQCGTARARKHEAQRVWRELRAGEDEVGEAEKARLRAATRDILSRLRPLGGVTVKVQKGSNEEAVASLQAAMEYYPSAWVEASNNNDVPVKVTQNSYRASYHPSRVEEKAVSVRLEEDVFRPEGETPRDTFSEEYVQAEDGHLDGHVRWRRQRYETYDGNNWVDETPEADVPKPKGRGWKLASVKASRRQPDGTYTQADIWMWRRPMMTTETRSTVVGPVLDVPGHTEEERVRVSLHEFGHRMESGNHPTGARLRRLQTAFYKRRTTGDDGKQQKLEKLGTGYRQEEETRPDGFATRYMGKIYRDGRTDEELELNYELLSVGAESVFHGATGGFVGLDGYGADLDTRNFIIGLWASA